MGCPQAQLDSCERNMVKIFCQSKNSARYAGNVGPKYHSVTAAATNVFQTNQSELL